jgi:hypothetical protein
MKVTLRRKQLSDGRQSLFLDYYHRGKRRYEYLGLYLTGNKQSDKEMLQLAQNIRSKRELEAASGEFGFDAKFKQESNLYDFLERFAETKPKRIGVYRQCKRHLLNFTQKEVLRFSDVTPFFLEQWKAYLLSVVTSNTARGLFFLPESSNETSPQRENHFQESVSGSGTPQSPQYQKRLSHQR